jgi:putative nucleotidyltransferase with HDIG domain
MTPERRFTGPVLLDEPARAVLARRTVTIIALILMVSAAHYWTPRGHDWLLIAHVTLAKLYVLPVVLAAIWFGLRGALAATLGATLLYAPHVVLQWAGTHPEHVSLAGELVPVWVTALLTGVFADREKAALRHVAAAYEGTVRALVAALDAREHDTEEHSLRVRAYTVRLAQELGVPPARQRTFALGALLHDIGKIGVPDAVLLKPGRLGDDEWQQIRRHPELGRRILASVPFLDEAAGTVHAHHERFDGSGYPQGLAGNAIPFGARVFAVADVYDALTTSRPYRQPNSYGDARAEIEKGAGTHFDPQVVVAFLRIPRAEWEQARTAAC